MAQGKCVRYLFFVGILAASSLLAPVSISALTWQRAYLLLGSGAGKTNWSELISRSRYDGVHFAQTTDITNPIAAGDTGQVIDLGLGYRWSDFFTTQFTYQHYPKTHIAFSMDPDMVVEREYILKIYNNMPADGKVSSKTDAFSFTGQFHIPVYGSKIDAYAAAGAGYVRRQDIMAHLNKMGAKFALGADYYFNKRWFANTAFSYYTGYGKSVTDPADAYVPFLFSVTLNVGVNL